MKMMDISMEDDCASDSVVPQKKKKMKQARLPFQMLSPAESPNSISNKKRKLTSPSVDCKSPKVVKITTKENSVEEKKETEVKTNIEDTEKGADGKDIEIIEVNEVKDAQKDKEPNDTEDDNSPKSTPKRRNKKRKKKHGTSSALTNFLTKTDEEERVEDEENPSTQEEEPYESSVENNSQESEALSESPNQKSKNTDTTLENESLSHNSESEVLLLSSENEDKDEESKADEDSGKKDKVTSPRTPKDGKKEKIAEIMKEKKLSARQQEKRLEIARRKQEKERLRMEREKKLEEEREIRRREKEEKRKEKEEKDRLEKEQKKKEKVMKELKKQMDIEQKQKEKEAKEEERRKREEAKEEEKKKKEEEKLEAERKKQKAASNFASFFVAKKQETKSAEEENVIVLKNFMPFEVKADMKVAPITRRVLNEDEKTSLVEKYTKGRTQRSELYVNEIKSKKAIPRKSSKTWPLETKDDVILIDDENDGSTNIVEETLVVEKHRPKLLQFCENRRPPYWGTWRKRSSNIKPRRPFSTDENCFNYEVDSDDEWEEEEPGESLHGSDDEKDEENPDDNEYDVDNEFMVPHGYLSDEEAHANEEDQEDMSPETQKFKLKVLGEQFESERNTKTSKLKPKIIGCIWQELGNKYSSTVPSRAMEFLSAREAWVRQIPVVLPTTSENESSVLGESGTPTHQQAPRSSKKSKFPAEALPDLIRLIHGNTHGRSFLLKEFMTYWHKKNKSESQISKASLMQKIREIGRRMACPEEGPMHLKACWYVTEDTRKKHVPDEDLTLPNRWSYSLTPKRKSEVLDVLDKPEKEDKDKDKKNVPLITQFTKKITQEEMKKQLTIKPDNAASPKATQIKTPKRATLISIGRGEQFSKASKESLLKHVVSNDKNKESSNKNAESDSDDIIFVESIDNDKPLDKKDAVNKSIEVKETSKSAETKKVVGSV